MVNVVVVLEDSRCAGLSEFETEEKIRYKEPLPLYFLISTQSTLRFSQSFFRSGVDLFGVCLTDDEA